MEFREFLAQHNEWDAVSLDGNNGGLLHWMGHLSPVMKIWLAAMLVNLIALLVLM